MDPKLKSAYLKNWLVNVTGKVDTFKEVDLLQEHQNFWLKVCLLILWQEVTNTRSRLSIVLRGQTEHGSDLQ